MTEMTVAECVVYVLDVGDRPGIAHAIAAVFSHRGLSIRALVADAHRKPPRILVVFEGTARQCRLVAGVLSRLHDVNSMRMLPASAPELRAIALCRSRAPLPALDDITVQPLGDTWLLSGSYAAIEAALRELQSAGLIDEVSRSLVAL